MNPIRCFCIGLMLLFYGISSSQTLGIALKFSLIIGSHSQGVGLGLHGYYTTKNLQCTLGNDLSFFLKSLGERKRFWENRSYAGISYVGGKPSDVRDFEWGNSINYTNYTCQWGYSYLYYADNAGTSQSSGAFAIESHRKSVYFENDFFAGQGKDRFRTANLVFRYREPFYALKMGLRLWTGETAGVGVKFDGKKTYFKDLSVLPLGKTSHGILYVGSTYLWMNGQSVGVLLGLDAEPIRNVFQNQLGHASFFHRDKSKAVKYPMLDVDGQPTFDPRQVRSPEYFFQMSLGGE